MRDGRDASALVDDSDRGRGSGRVPVGGRRVRTDCDRIGISVPAAGIVVVMVGLPEPGQLNTVSKSLARGRASVEGRRAGGGGDDDAKTISQREAVESSRPGWVVGFQVPCLVG